MNIERISIGIYCLKIIIFKYLNLETIRRKLGIIPIIEGILTAQIYSLMNILRSLSASGRYATLHKLHTVFKVLIV